MNAYSILLLSSCVLTFAFLMVIDTLLEKRRRKKGNLSRKIPTRFFVARGFTYLAFMLGTGILVATIWMRQNFKETDLASLFFHMHVQLTSTDIKNFRGLYKCLSLFIPIGSLLLSLLGKACSHAFIVAVRPH